MKTLTRWIVSVVASLALAAGVQGASAQSDAAAAKVKNDYESRLDLTSGDGLTASYGVTNFRYGTYCGAGVPDNLTPLEEEERGGGVRGRIGGLLGRGGDDDAEDSSEDDTKGVVRQTRLGELRGDWPAHDQLDALCFAHDYCFDVIGHDSFECDYAFTSALSSMIGRYDAAGNTACGNVASMMYVAFLNKPWADSDLGRLIRLAEIATLYEDQASQMQALLTSRLAQSAAGLPRTPGSCGSVQSVGDLNIVFNDFSSRVDNATAALISDLQGTNLVGLLLDQAGVSDSGVAARIANTPGLSNQLNNAVLGVIGANASFFICGPQLAPGSCSSADAEMVDTFDGRRRMLVNLVRIAAIANGASRLDNLPGNVVPRDSVQGVVGGLLRRRD